MKFRNVRCHNVFLIVVTVFWPLTNPQWIIVDGVAAVNKFHDLNRLRLAIYCVIVAFRRNLELSCSIILTQA